jgi:serine/threonine protein phosphatase 1
MGNIFVVGDIHGAYPALIQCLQRSDFNYEKDTLICLGDVADGWPETKSCINELRKIKNLVYVLGNHDFWTLEWMQSGIIDPIWYDQGGKATIDSYHAGVPEEHMEFLKNALPYFISNNNKLFVHAGINPLVPIEVQTLQTFLWDRNLARTAIDFFQKEIDFKLTDYAEVFIGHTPILYPRPIRSGDVWLMDTGAGWSGVLSIMNIATKAFWTSDSVPTLFPGIEGRKRK